MIKKRSSKSFAVNQKVLERKISKIVASARDGLLEIDPSAIIVRKMNPGMINLNSACPFIFRKRDENEIIIFLNWKEMDYASDLEGFRGIFSQYFSQKFHLNEYALPRLACLVKSPVQYQRGEPVFNTEVMVPGIVVAISPKKIKALLMTRRTRAELAYFRESVRSFLVELFLGIGKSAEEQPATVNIVKEQNESALFEWESKFNKCMSIISKGIADKIVLSRYENLRVNGRVNLKALWGSLNRLKHRSYKYMIENYPGYIFASTPERLFKLDGNILETEALAGTFVKGTIDSAYEKNIFEHKLVRDHLVDKISGIGGVCNYNDVPLIKPYSKINHYLTPIKAAFKDTPDFITILKEIFPTPATTGYPVVKAAEKLPGIEKYDRDYYTGAVGLIYNMNKAEFAVNLRCGRVNSDKITLYAGCGLVRGSDAKKEFEESELKLRSMATIFNL